MASPAVRPVVASTVPSRAGRESREGICELHREPWDETDRLYVSECIQTGTHPGLRMRWAVINRGGGFGAPARLVFLSAGRLALFGITADARIRIEPPKTDPAGALPGLGNARSTVCLTNRQVLLSRGGNFSLAPKARAVRREWRT